jgi:hypothetical protein
VVNKERWLEKKRADILPVKYFHTVFTLPHDLNPIVLCNKSVMLEILFQSVSETLLEFGKNPKNGLGGELGFIAILHTWDQQLRDHFHLHCLIPGGVLSMDESRWISCKKEYLFPVDALKIVFRGKFMDYFKEANREKKLIFPGNTSKFADAMHFRRLEKDLYDKEWVIHIKKPVEEPDYVLDYLGRYTHRVAISNNRIQALDNGKVTFTYRNREANTTEESTIDSVSFIRRFLQHVLPKRFFRIRSYGFLANRCKTAKVKKCRELLGDMESSQNTEQSIRDLMLRLTGEDIELCRICRKGKMKEIREIPKRTGEDPFDVIWPAELRSN